MPTAREMTPEVKDFIAKGVQLIQAATDLSGQPLDTDTMQMMAAVRTLCGSLMAALDTMRQQAPPSLPQTAAAAAAAASASQSRSKS